ncbi:DUF2567 domain-containing protein [Amycolatopsis sp. FDAARGOS 1241]|uniref:DUF2567 domain-containing protein n=1 Tax=Amycolatopsis sp. FDAARGOS 1241 TaxID=2778070 RepID=UPI001952745E|nr:DUF2567 domain-containing protein [Amycolatopsis sp. FDAARGOS 1241]QRP44193.1 DUF2567 domain-containing protein [Amycolatopsis sp. FDAARGOS 1241]
MVDSAGKAAHRSSAVADAWSVPNLFPPHRVRPTVVVKADLLPAISVLSTAGLLGIPLGWLWSLMAPPQRERVVTADGQRVPLELESWHRFDDLAIYGLLALATGLVIGIVVWLLRERRGPVVFLAAAGGAALAGWLGTQVGVAFVNAKYAIDTPPALGAVIAEAPRLESGWIWLAAPLMTALVYALLTAWNGREDLGRRLG